MEPVRLSINEHMTSVGEEILCVFENHQRGVDGCRVDLNVRVFVWERVSVAAEFMSSLFQREIETLETQLQKQNKLLDVILQPNIKLHRAEVSPEHEERSPSLVKQETQTSQIEEGQEEEAFVSTLTLLHTTRCNTLSDVLHLPVYKEYKEEVSPEEERSPSLMVEVDTPMLTLPAVKSKADCENRDTEHVASSSNEHLKTQADVEDCGTSLPTSDDHHLSSHCSESDITEDSDEWETSVDQSPLNTLKSHKMLHVEGQRLPLRNKMSQDFKSSKEKKKRKAPPPARCAVPGCGLTRSDMKRHLKGPHKMVDGREILLFLKLARGHININRCPCPVTVCRYRGLTLKRHIVGVHGKESKDAKLRLQITNKLLHMAQWLEVKRQLAELRASNPHTIISTLDLEEGIPRDVRSSSEENTPCVFGQRKGKSRNGKRQCEEEESSPSDDCLISRPPRVEELSRPAESFHPMKPH